MSGQNLFAFAFSPPASLPKILSRITRADMGIHLPRLDDKCVDEQGNPDPAKKKALDEKIERYRAVYVVGGQIVSTKATKGQADEPGVRFVGQFKALVNPLFGGSTFVSSRCHVPRFYEEVLFTNFQNAQKTDPEGKPVTMEFLVGVGIKPPKDGKPSMTGYEWTVEPLVDLGAADDPVDALFSRARERAALAAPAPAADPSPAEAASSTQAENGAAPEANDLKKDRSHLRRGSHAS